MLSMVLLILAHQYASAAPCGVDEFASDMHYYQQTSNLIQTLINWHISNVKYWLVVGVDNNKLLSGDVPKIICDQNNLVSPTESRDYAAIFFTDSNSGLEQALNKSLKLPTDVIKIYFDRSGCQLNETNLAEIMRSLWISSEIGFIYYISYCCLSTTSNYDSIDNQQLPHKDNRNCTINLFHHQPFVENKSGQWGVLEKLDLINDHAGEAKAAASVARQWINMSSQVFHDFPFQRKHNLKLNRLNMTVILLPSTNAFLKSGMELFRGQLSQEILDDPLHHDGAYFGEDAELLRELRKRMNFQSILSTTSDGQFYGFKKADGSFVGALGDIISKRADFIVNACFVKDYLTDLLEFTTSIDDDKLCIVTKTAALVPDSLLIFRLFSTTVWILIVITVITVAFSYTILMTMIDDVRMKSDLGGALGKFSISSFRRRISRKIRSDADILYRIIGVMLGAASISNISNSSHERFFVSICLLWSLVCCGTFQGSLYNVYSTPKAYPNIDTLQNLFESGLVIHVRHQGLLTDIFGNEKAGSILGNLRTMRLEPSSDDFLNERIMLKGDVAGLTRYANYDYENSRLEPRQDGTHNLHTVSECPRSYTLASLFRKRSIYIDAVNWNINMFMQSGLTVKWKQDSKNIFKRESALKYHRRMQTRSARVKINLRHLLMAFLLLTLGNLLSFFVFAHEKYCERRERKK